MLYPFLTNNKPTYCQTLKILAANLFSFCNITFLTLCAGEHHQSESSGDSAGVWL